MSDTSLAKPPLTGESLSSVLNSRIDQAISIVSPTEPDRIALLHAIRAIDSSPMQVASLSDYLIDYIATLSLELNSARIALDKRQEVPQAASGTVSGDYRKCLELLRDSRDRLADRIERLTQQNERMQRRHREDRARIARNRKLLQKLRPSAFQDRPEGDDEDQD
jgi:hypothetical protein